MASQRPPHKKIVWHDSTGGGSNIERKKKRITETGDLAVHN